MRRNPRKLPLDVLIPRIQEVNEYIREGMKHRLSDEDSSEYRPITVNRSKQTVTFHYVQFLEGEEPWKDSWQFPAKTKSEISEIREELTRAKRLLMGWMRRSHSPKKMRRPPPVYTKRDKRTGRFTENPRKISVEAADALMAGKKFKSGNTQVKMVVHGLYDLTLHGNSIAVFDVHHQELMVRDGGYPSTVTKERLNALPNVQVQTKKGQLYLNGKKWNGDTVLVIKDSVPTFPYRKV